MYNYWTSARADLRKSKLKRYYSDYILLCAKYTQANLAWINMKARALKKMTQQHKDSHKWIKKNNETHIVHKRNGLVKVIELLRAPIVHKTKIYGKKENKRLYLVIAYNMIAFFLICSSTDFYVLIFHIRSPCMCKPRLRQLQMMSITGIALLIRTKLISIWVKPINIVWSLWSDRG